MSKQPRTNSFTPPPPPHMSSKGRRLVPRRRLSLWGFLLVAVLAAGLGGFAALPDSAEGRNRANHPTSLKALSITDTGVTLTWTPGVVVSGCTIDEHRVWVQTDVEAHEEEDETIINGRKVATPATSTVITGLTPGTRYLAEVSSHSPDCGGVSNSQASVRFTTTGIAPPPSTETETETEKPSKKKKAKKPKNLTASNISSTQATLTWKPGVVPSGCTVNEHHVWVHTNVEAHEEDDETIVDGRRVATPATSTVITGLTPGTRYRAEVAAHSSDCGGVSDSQAEVTFTTGAAPTPEPALIISSSAVSVAEGDSGSTTMTFSVTLSGSPRHEVRLKATTRGGTRSGVGVAAKGLGVVGRDFYQFTGRSVVFEAGATGAALTKTVTVQIRGDHAVESNEVLTLRLNNLQSDDSRVRFSSNGTRLEVTGTITNDDAAAQVSHVITASPVSVAEGDSGRTTMTFTVTLSHSPSHQVQIRATTRGGTRDGVGVAAKGLAGEGRDFHRFTGRNIVFEANATGEGLTKTVTVVIRGDEVAESDEVLTLRLNNLRTSDPRVHFSSNGKRLEVTGTITNDD